MPSPVPRRATPTLAASVSPSTRPSPLGTASPSRGMSETLSVNANYAVRGTKRTLAVEALAVRDALRMLDGVKETPSPTLGPATIPSATQVDTSASMIVPSVASVKVEPAFEGNNNTVEYGVVNDKGERERKKRRVD